MTFIVYFFLALASLPITLLGLLLSPVLPLFAAQEYGWVDNHSKEELGPRLPKWLSWFQTPDNSLDGDATFQILNGFGYWTKVKWLCRNPAYAFALQYIDTTLNKPVLSGNDSVKDNDNAVSGWCFVKCANLFQFTWVCPIGFNRCIYCVFGWNIRGILHQEPKVDYQATFAFSPRISGFR
jgi:hypothetical protein